jgi:hypothetical protein
VLLRFNWRITLVHTPAEFVYAGPEPTCQLWQLLAAEKQQDNDHQKNHFAHVGHAEKENHA